MKPHYFVFTLKGWWGQNGQYVDDIYRAQPFTYEEAVSFCRRQRGPNQRLDFEPPITAVPVSVREIEAIMLGGSN